MSTTTNLTTLKINYLTQAQYDDALANNQINEDEIYLTPQSGSTAETDPIFSASPAASITTTDITNWNGKTTNTITLNGTQTASPSFYAPTGAGTSGQYLKSNGSGAPAWTNFPSIPSAGTSAEDVGTTSSGGSATTWSKSDHVHKISSSTITTALGYTPYNSTNPNGYTSNTGTVTSVRVQATSPVTSSTSTAQTGTLNTTIALADNYGDTKNPYASKTKNYVLAAPATAAGTPSFRALVKADIPTLDYVPTSNPYVTSQGTVSGGWMYRKWSNNFQEVWFRGTVTYTSAGVSYQGWYRSVQKVTIPISSMTGMSAFADDAVAIASGAHSSHIHTCSGLQSSGTEFEAQTLGMNAIAANTATSGWSVYIAGYKR